MLKKRRFCRARKQAKSLSMGNKHVQRSASGMLFKFIIKFLNNARSHCLKSVLYESTKHGTNESSRHYPQKWQMNFRFFSWVLLKLSVKGLLRYCQVLSMEHLSRRPVQQFFQAQKVFTLEFFIYKNFQQVFRFQPQVMNSLFSNCHVGKVEVFMGNNSAGFH